MHSTFFLKNLPRRGVLEDLARRYPDLRPGAVEALLVFLRVASELLGVIDSRMAERGMSQGKFCVLMQLNMAPGEGLNPSEIAGRVGVTRATITGLVDGLERSGFIQRRRGLPDRRSQLIHLTPRGKGFLDQFLPIHYRRTAKIMSRLGPRDQRNLIALLDKVARGLQELGDL